MRTGGTATTRRKRCKSGRGRGPAGVRRLPAGGARRAGPAAAGAPRAAADKAVGTPVVLESHVNKRPADAGPFVATIVRTLGRPVRHGAALRDEVERRMSRAAGSAASLQDIHAQVKEGRRQFIEGNFAEATKILGRARSAPAGAGGRRGLRPDPARQPAPGPALFDPRPPAGRPGRAGHRARQRGDPLLPRPRPVAGGLRAGPGLVLPQGAAGDGPPGPRQPDRLGGSARLHGLRQRALRGVEPGAGDGPLPRPIPGLRPAGGPGRPHPHGTRGEGATTSRR